MAINYVSPGAEASKAIRNEMVLRAQLQRQAEQDALLQAREERMSRADASNEEIKREQLEIARQGREEAAKTAAATRGKQVADSTAIGVVDDATAGAIKGYNPSLVGEQQSLAAKSLDISADPFNTDAPIVPGAVMAQEGTGHQEFKGTKQDQELNKFLTSADIPDSVKAYVKASAASGDKTLPYQLFEGEKAKTIVRVSADKRGMEIFNKGKWEPATGDIPKDAQLIMEPQPDSGGGQPYFIPITTAQGIIPFNARTGEFNDAGRRDLKPGETAGKDISGALLVGEQIDSIKNEFNPKFVGVVAGRVKNLDQKLWGSDPDYARFQAQLRTLGNTVIQLRTGAQMSVEEAKRILEEVSTENLPVPTFVARLNRLEELYDQYLANRTKVAYGRTTKEDVDKMVNPKPNTPLSVDGKAKPTAADLIKKYGSTPPAP